MTKLTATSLAKAKPGDILRDDQVPGLHVKVGSRRSTFYLYFRTPTRQERRPKVGDYGVLTIPQARDIARSWLLQNAKGEAVKPGVTPAQQRTVQELYERWQRDHKPKLKPETARGMESNWTVHILPRLGRKRIMDVTDDDAAAMFAAISATHPTTANRTLTLLGTAFKLAEKWKWRTQNTNPCFGLDRNKEVKRKRYLKIEELQRLGAVLQAWEQEGGYHRKASRVVRLLIMTGARKSEITRCPRAWVDLEAGVIRAEDSKTGEKLIALPAAAVRLIHQMYEDEPNSPWLVPGRRPHKPLHNFYNAWLSLLEQAAIENLRIHDLRHSFASIGVSALGLSLKQVGGVLGHADAATTQRYGHLMLPEHKAITEGIANVVERLLLPAPVVGAVLEADALNGSVVG